MNTPDPQPQNCRITCIVPVYNEQDRLPAVLSVLASHPMLDEVLVVDDGSSDDSAKVAQQYDVTLIRQPQNGGKTRALATGIAKARHPFIMLIDGDLLGLTSANITQLAQPVRERRADITISLRGNAPRLWHWIGLDYISGERVFARNLLPENPEALHRLPPFGFEVYLNDRLTERSARIAVIAWPNVKSPLKSGKRGLLAGIAADIAMLGDMFRTVPPLRLLRQIRTMRRLRIGDSG